MRKELKEVRIPSGTSRTTSSEITSHYKGPRRRKERERARRKLFEEIMAEYFPNLGKETDIQVQEAQRV